MKKASLLLTRLTLEIPFVTKRIVEGGLTLSLWSLQLHYLTTTHQASDSHPLLGDSHLHAVRDADIGFFVFFWIFSKETCWHGLKQRQETSIHTLHPTLSHKRLCRNP